MVTADEQDPTGRSLEQVENHDWGDPPPDATRLIAAVHRLRRKPIKHLTTADLRTLIAQRVGLTALVPRVLPHLEHDPYVEADHYPGDLLAAVLRIPATHWKAHPRQRFRVEQITAAIDEPDDQLKADIAAFHTGQ